MADVNFFRRGVTRVWFCPTITGSPVLTAPDASADFGGSAIDLTDFVADLTGFTFSNQPITIPKLTDNFDGQIPGVDAAAASNIKFYEVRDDASAAAGGGTGNDTIRVAVAKGKSGFIVIFWGGCKATGGVPGTVPTTADRCEVWPAISTGPAREYVMTATAATWNASFSVTARPAVDATLVA